MCSTFQVNDALSVVCFRRNHALGPYFAVREFDTKVIRSSSKNKKIVGRGPSEQAVRASIRQAILNMALRSERASKAEIRALKQQGILGKRAPSCALLCAEDMLKLLEAFDRPEECDDLKKALEKEGKKPKEEKEMELEFAELDQGVAESQLADLDADEEPEAAAEAAAAPVVAAAAAAATPTAAAAAATATSTATTRTSARIKRRATRAVSPSNARWDALLQAIGANENNTAAHSENNAANTQDEHMVQSSSCSTHTRGEKVRRVSFKQTSPEMDSSMQRADEDEAVDVKQFDQFVLPFPWQSAEEEAATALSARGETVPVSVSVC